MPAPVLTLALAVSANGAAADHSMGQFSGEVGKGVRGARLRGNLLVKVASSLSSNERETMTMRLRRVTGSVPFTVQVGSMLVFADSVVQP